MPSILLSPGGTATGCTVLSVDSVAPPRRMSSAADKVDSCQRSAQGHRGTAEGLGPHSQVCSVVAGCRGPQGVGQAAAACLDWWPALCWCPGWLAPCMRLWHVLLLTAPGQRRAPWHGCLQGVQGVQGVQATGAGDAGAIEQGEVRQTTAGSGSYIQLLPFTVMQRQGQLRRWAHEWRRCGVLGEGTASQQCRRAAAAPGRAAGAAAPQTGSTPGRQHPPARTYQGQGKAGSGGV
jgi:hypothetical protein